MSVCRVKECDQITAVAQVRRIRGFIGHQVIHLCVEHCEKQYSEKMLLKNGGSI